MRHALRAAAFLLLAMLVLPGITAQDKKDAKKDKDIDSPKKDTNLIKVGTVTATIVTADESKKTLRVRVEVPKLNPGAVQGLQNAQIALAQAQARAPNDTGKPGAIRSALQQIAQHQANLYTKEAQEVELGTTDDYLVRLLNPPPKFDEKGKIVRYNKKELDELKGENKKLPGYKGEFSDLRSNMIVQVTLMRHKNAGRPPKINPKTKEPELDLMVDNKLQASMIMVIGEPKQPGQ